LYSGEKERELAGEILKKEKLAPEVVLMEINAPEIAQKRKAGQFVVLRIHEEGERIPLTISDADPEKGTLTLVYQEVGKTTLHLSTLNVGDKLTDIVGPLGKPTHVENFGTVVGIGGGLGIAPLHPIIQAMKQAGNHVISIIGGRNKELVILEDWVKAASDEVFISTDDGSYGHHGFVSDVLQNLIDEGKKIDLVVAIGPVPMMRACCNVTEETQIPTVVSLNTLMVDATGMCGVCRVTVGDQTKFACVDGPEFDGHQVNFPELIKRQRTYIEMEKESLLAFRQKCECERKQ
jgi:ferredoxin--NADP+ reductase